MKSTRRYTIKTEEILKQLKDSTSLKTFLDENKGVFYTSKLSIHLHQLLEERSLGPSYLIKNTQLSKSYVYKLMAGERAISKDRLLQIAFALQCNIDECNQLLKSAGLQSLYAKNERDCVIIHGIIQHLDIFQMDNLLEEHGLKSIQNQY